MKIDEDFTMRVTKEHVKANQKAIRDMVNWKKDYRAVTRAIRDMKLYINDLQHWNVHDEVSKQTRLLHMMQREARGLMVDRVFIKAGLRMTAYRYAA